MEAGFEVVVEKSSARFFRDSEFSDVGCKLAETNAWVDAPNDVLVTGLKELPESKDPLKHRHLYFAHCYKSQHGWKDILARFDNGGGLLLDLEFLTDDNGRRVAAFGYHAGFAGMALGIDLWCHQQMNILKAEAAPYPPVKPFPDEAALISHIKSRIESVQQKKGNKNLYPKVHVMGYLGRCGAGAVDMAKGAGIPDEFIVKWDMVETKKGGPFPEIMQSDVFVNCIYLMSKIPPFLTRETLAAGGPLSVVVDVSCDYTNPNNPLPIYNEGTTFDRPYITIPKSEADGTTLDVISIDHLPTLLPRESSDRFANDLLPSLLKLKEVNTDRLWRDAIRLFRDKVAESKQ